MNDQPSRTPKRVLYSLAIGQAILLAGVVGWFIGRAQVQTHNTFGFGGPPVAGMAYELPASSRHLLAGIQCPSCKQDVAAAINCNYCYSMRAFVLGMIERGAAEEQIKAELLRKYGEEALKGRKW